MRALPLFLLFLLFLQSLLAGCVRVPTLNAPPGVETRTSFSYAIYRNGTQEGWVNFTTDEASIRVLDAAFGWVNGTMWTISFTERLSSGAVFHDRYQDAETSNGWTPVFFEACDVPGAPPGSGRCSQNGGYAQWQNTSVSLLLFGSSLVPPRLPGHGTIRIPVGNRSRTLTVDEIRAGTYRLEPQSHAGPRFILGSCNPLDDEVTVNLRAHLIVACRFLSDGPSPDQKYTSYRLRSPVGHPSGIAESSPDRTPLPTPALGPLKPRNGILPPGSNLPGRPGDMSFAQAYRVALNQSSGFRGFLRNHPEASLADVYVSGRTSGRTLGVYEDTSMRIQLRIVASGGKGYEVEVQRSTRYLNGQREQRSYNVTSDGPWDPPTFMKATHLIPPPSSFVSLRDAYRNISKRFPGGWVINGTAVTNLQMPGDPHVIIAYGFSHPGGILFVDARNGHLMYGVLSPERRTNLTREVGG